MLFFFLEQWYEKKNKSVNYVEKMKGTTFPETSCAY